MTRPEELAHYSELIASLTVSAARTDDPEKLSRIHAELSEAFADVFALLDEAPFDPADLLRRSVAR